jgi:two-component system OmpR family response regulator
MRHENRHDLGQSIMKTEQKQRILLVEDDETFADEFGGYLRTFGYDVHHVDTLSGLAELAAHETFDIILLDQIVRGQDSIGVIENIRMLFDGPVIMITNNTEVVDRIIALETGADDFIVKLQPSREILARIRAVIRRTILTHETETSPHTLEHQPHEPDESAWRVSHRSRTLTTPGGARVAMSSAEFDLLVFLAKRRGRQVTRDEISKAVFGRPYAGARDRTVDNILSRLRRALMPFLDSGNAVRSLRGTGYVFVGFDLFETDRPPGPDRRASEQGRRRTVGT